MPKQASNDGEVKAERTRRYFTPDDKFRIVMEALESGKASDVIRARGLHQNVFYRWRQTFLDGAKRALAGVSNVSDADSDLIARLREENSRLKVAVGELYMKTLELEMDGALPLGLSHVDSVTEESDIREEAPPEE